MKIEKITKFLLLVSFAAIVFDLARLDIWGTTDLLYLVWNLFLAWIPYIISVYCIKKDTPVVYFTPLLFLWLLFFPNAPYLVTDILHVSLSLPPLLWYDSLLLFFFGWIGLLLGLLSLSYIHQYLRTHLNYWYSEIFILAICFVSSCGIYLGRFERWNSWDLFISPFQMIKTSIFLLLNLFHAGTPLLFMSVFTTFLYLAYKTIQVLLVDKNEV